MTPLDHSSVAMQARPEDAAARMQYYERLAASELSLVLEAEAGDDTARPALFEVEGTSFALVFDTPDRMAQFCEGATPSLTASGRAIVEMILPHGIGLGVNLGVEASQQLLPPDAIEWMAQQLGTAPETEEGKPTRVLAPGKLPEPLIRAFDARLANMAGMARAAYLAQMEYENRPRAHVMVFVDAHEPAQPAMAQAISEAIAFSGVEAASLDVIFLEASNPICADLARFGLRFDLPEPEVVQPVVPGSDPEKPPRLR